MQTADHQSRPEFPNDRGAHASQQPRLVNSEQLLSGERELLIEHNGARYRLRLTANDKLILTK